MRRLNTMFGLLNWFFTPVKLYGGDGGDGGDGGGLSSDYSSLSDAFAGDYGIGHSAVSSMEADIARSGASAPAAGYVDSIPDWGKGYEGPSPHETDYTSGAWGGGGWTTEQFEGGEVSYNTVGDYSVTMADGTTYGHDTASGISYSTDEAGKYGVTASVIDPKTGETITAKFNNITDLKAEMEQKRLIEAKKAGIKVGSVLGPTGAVMGYLLGDKIYAAVNPDAVAETLTREGFISTAESNYAASEGIGQGGGDSTASFGSVDSSVTLTQEQAGQLLNTGELNVDANGTVEEPRAIGDYSGFKVPEINIATSTGSGLTKPDYTAYKSPEQISVELSEAPNYNLPVPQIAGGNYVEQIKAQQAAWEEVYAPVEKNLVDYYSNLKADSFAARSVQQIQKSFEEQQTTIAKNLAQRGLDTSGLWGDTMLKLGIGAAEAKAQARIDAPSQVAAEQASFMQLGIQKEQMLEQGLTTAMGIESQQNIAQANIAAAQSRAELDAQSRMDVANLQSETQLAAEKYRADASMAEASLAAQSRYDVASMQEAAQTGRTEYQAAASMEEAKLGAASRLDVAKTATAGDIQKAQVSADIAEDQALWSAAGYAVGSMLF